MSVDWQAVCYVHRKQIHLGQTFSSGFVSAYGSKDSAGQVTIGLWLQEHCACKPVILQDYYAPSTDAFEETELEEPKRPQPSPLIDIKITELPEPTRPHATKKAADRYAKQILDGFHDGEDLYPYSKLVIEEALSAELTPMKVFSDHILKLCEAHWKCKDYCKLDLRYPCHLVIEAGIREVRPL